MSPVERLRQLDTCAVSDACDQLGLQDRVSIALRPSAPGGPSRIAGRALTVLLGRPEAASTGTGTTGTGTTGTGTTGTGSTGTGSTGTGTTGTASSGGPRRHLCAAATDAATSDDVLVIAHQGRTDCAGWGGNLSRAARQRGAAGTIVDGAVRDVDEAIEVGYAVFATAATPRTARGRAEEKSWGEPVEIDGIPVRTGDYVIADSSGAVFVAAVDLDAVLKAAEEIAAKEAAMAAVLDAGRATVDVMGASYETMLE